MDDMPLAITPIYAGLAALLYVALAIRIINQRYKSGIGLGTGDDPVLLSRVRTHANFAEYVPFSLLLLAFAELNGLPPLLLHAAGVLLLAARLAHAWGLFKTEGASVPRAAGMATTFGIMVLTSAFLIVTGVWSA